MNDSNELLKKYIKNIPGMDIRKLPGVYDGDRKKLEDL